MAIPTKRATVISPAQSTHGLRKTGPISAPKKEFPSALHRSRVFRLGDFFEPRHHAARDVVLHALLVWRGAVPVNHARRRVDGFASMELDHRTSFRLDAADALFA